MSIKKELKYFLKKLSNNPSKLFNRSLFLLEISCYFFIFVPLLYIDRLLPESKRIYFARFRSNRIGHFAPGFHIRYAKVKLGIYKENVYIALMNKLVICSWRNKLEKLFL